MIYKKTASPPALKRSMSKLSKVLAEHGLGADRRFGQCFLANQGVLESIVRVSAAGPHTAVVEIGAGLGNLTELLARNALKVAAVELDRHFESIHAQYLGHLKNVVFAYGDFLDLRLDRLFADLEAACQERIVVGNIPYNITSKILMKLLDERQAYDRAYILMQREVAERLRAKPGDKRFSVLTAKLSTAFEMRVALMVGAGSFLPAPKVESALVEFKPAACPLEIAEEERGGFFAMLDGAFGFRRKTLPNALDRASGGAWPRASVAQALRDRNLPETARAESLETAQMLALYRQLFSAHGAADFIGRRA